MKRDALRTESETSHRITTCGFSFLRFSKRSLKGTPPYARFWRRVRLISKRPFFERLRRTVITFFRRCARRVTASFIFLSSSSENERGGDAPRAARSEEHTSELPSPDHLVFRL